MFIVVGDMSQGEEEEGGAEKSRVPDEKRGDQMTVYWLPAKVVLVTNEGGYYVP